jgi:hypothetical protein
MTATDIVARRRWAYGLISRAATPAPRYGSREWLALPNDDPRKVAGCVVAAECWAVDGDDIEGRLAVDLDAARAAHKAAEDEEYADRAAEHRRTFPVPAQRRRCTPNAVLHPLRPPRPLEQIAAEYLGHGDAS